MSSDAAAMHTVAAAVSTRSEVTMHDYSELLRTLDGVLENRALVFGSLPPTGRDIDLLVTPDDELTLGSALRAREFVERGRHWVSFGGCSVAVVEVIPAASLRVPGGELDAVLADGLPLAGLARIVEPAPHHMLLILARKLVHERALPAKHRARIDRALALDPAAWERARERATLWSAGAALARLEALSRRPEGSRPHWRQLVRFPRRTRVIAISGADDERTASHSRALRDALYRLGFEPVVESPLMSARHEAAAALSLWRPIWRRLGKGAVVIYHGHALDCAVALCDGDPGDASLVRRARRLRMLAPTPLRTYYLDFSASAPDPHRAAAYRIAAQKLAVRWLDAERPAGQLCEEIAADAWRAVSRRTRVRSALRSAAIHVRRR